VIDEASRHGVEAAWFFQTGTSLPIKAQDDEDEDEDEDEDVAVEKLVTQPVPDVEAGWTDEVETSVTEPIDLLGAIADEDDEDEDDGEDDEDDATWSHGPPPQLMSVRFPVDNYPAILEELDWDDFGITLKLAGAFTQGEATALLGFHTLWLAPYGERYRNAAVTVDRRHHSAHLWVDRFAVPVSNEIQVHHLLWVLSKLDEVVPIIHARFGGRRWGRSTPG